MHLYAIDGATAPLSSSDTAFSYRDERYSTVIASLWDDPPWREANIAWVRDDWNTLQPHGPGEGTSGASRPRDTLNAMAAPATYDLWYDPNRVGGDLVVECWISHGPRADDAGFDPQPGDVVRAGDDEEEPLKARVTRREANRVWIQLRLVNPTESVA